MDSSAPLRQPDSAGKVEDEQLLLSPDQAELIETFRRDVRRCKTDAEKFPSNTLRCLWLPPGGVVG